jgi:hypothetical protein
MTAVCSGEGKSDQAARRATGDEFPSPTAAVLSRGQRIVGGVARFKMEPSYGLLGRSSQYLAGSPHISEKATTRSPVGKARPTSMSVTRPRTMPVAVVFQWSSAICAPRVIRVFACNRTSGLMVCSWRWYSHDLPIVRGRAW